MLLNTFKFHVPTTLKEALHLYNSFEDARLVAGGTFLLNSLKLLKRKGLKTPSNVISLRKLNELQGISINGDELIIKSMTVINDVFNYPLLENNWNILKKVCRNISTNPVRNMATLGGNLTSRYTWTELGCVLIALNAKMNFIDANNKIEQISVEEFFENSAKTNKILLSVSIKRDKKCRLTYQRVKRLSDVDVPLLAVCLKTTIDQNRFTDTHVVINSGVVFAKRDKVLENFLNSSIIDPNLAKEALDNLDNSIYDNRSDDYKKHMFRISIKNAILELIGGKNDSEY